MSWAVLLHHSLPHPLQLLHLPLPVLNKKRSLIVGNEEMSIHGSYFLYGFIFICSSFFSSCLVILLGLAFIRQSVRGETLREI